MKPTIRTLATALVALVFALAVGSCSSDDDGVVHVEFSENTVAGTWKIAQMDSVASQAGKNGSLTDVTLSTTEYENTYFVIGDGNYTVWQGSADNIVDRGTYTLATSSYRIDLSNGTKINYRKRNGNTMILEVPNKNDATRRARYTLIKQ